MSIIESEEQPRKGRSNAILTYETVSAIEMALVRVDAKLDNVTEKVGDMKTLHTNHEVRIKALELASASTIAAATSARGTWQWVWTAIISVPGTVATIILLFEKLGG